MSKEELLQRKAAIEQRFEEVKAELSCVQGEYRLIEDLLRTYDEQPAEVPQQRLRKVIEDAQD